MPIWLRNFTYRKIVEEKDKENERNQPKTKGKKTTNIDLNNPHKTKDIPKYPSVKPDYSTKASNK